MNDDEQEDVKVEELDGPSAGEASNFIREVLSPLSPNTAKLLSPVKLAPNDKMRISIDPLNDKYFIIEIYAELHGARVKASYPAETTWLRRLTSVKQLTANRHRIPATDTHALIINAVWPIEQLTFSPEAHIIYSYLLGRFFSQTLQSTQRAEFKINRKVPNPPTDFLDSASKPLTNYQQTALFTNSSCLFMEQGTGKTPIVIREVCEDSRAFFKLEKERLVAEKRKKRNYNVLIVCPRNVRNNWRREFEEFTTVKGKVTILRGTKLDRFRGIAEAIASDDDIHYSVCVCSYEAVSRTFEFLSKIPWNAIYLDESHYIKRPTTKRWQSIRELRNNSDKRRVLTGTPITNSVMDLYTQLEFIEEGASGFVSFEDFKQFYGVYEERFDAGGGSGFERLTGYQNLPFLQERLARFAFLISKKEALPTMPDKIYEEREVTMSGEQIEWYEKIQDELTMEVKNADMSNTVTANHFLTRMLRLAQITSGFLRLDPPKDALGIPTGPPTVQYAKINPKLNELMKIMEETTDKDKVLIFAHWIADINLIARTFKEKGIPFGVFTGATSDKDRIACEDNFNKLPATQFKALIVNAAAGGTGLNLRGYDPNAKVDHECNCSKVVYYSQDWSMVNRSQSEDRAHRKGTRVPVTYIDLTVPNSIDEEIRTAVSRKRLDASEVQNLRVIMTRILETKPMTDSDIDMED